MKIFQKNILEGPLIKEKYGHVLIQFYIKIQKPGCLKMGPERQKCREMPGNAGPEVEILERTCFFGRFPFFRMAYSWKLF